MQKLDENKKLFLAGQRSDKRYGFIDANISNNQVDETTMEIDPSTNSSNSYLDKNALSRNQSTSGTETATGCSQSSENISEYQVSSKKQKVPPKIDVMNAELASALDRANISNGDSTYVLTAAYKSIGINIETLNLSCSTIRRARIMYRQSITELLKDEFKIEDRYIVHWDEKILTDIVDPKSVDRIAILLSFA
ncbi:Protein of unknown function [Cotesia congregata]|uniref:Uncharacterized protein n=1 Tax=Cotesia congregata TaxID=51543 RepID=A0A8J2E9V3_COTCN|nr:Protein of unknown function [Cotesia congregata]